MPVSALPHGAVLCAGLAIGAAAWLASDTGLASERLRAIHFRPSLPVTNPLLQPLARFLRIFRHVTARWRNRLSRNRVAACRREAVAELCAALSAELCAGRTPNEALQWATTNFDDDECCARLGRAARVGGDVPAAMRAAATQSGGGGLRALAACWQVGETNGAGLVTAAARLAAGLRAEQAQRRHVDAELAGPRATARLLAILPLFGLLLGSGLGADPLRFLLTTPPGLFCLGLGGILEVLGLLWTNRIAQASLGGVAG